MTTLTDHQVVITEPGLYTTVTPDQYHADPVPGGSLSSTGARALLPPSCPARYRWDLDNGQTPRRHWDLGHAAHRVILGAGHDLAPIDADNYQTKAARAARDEARTAGLVPVLPHELDTVHAMAKALREHPVASALLAPGSGIPEAVIVWQDEHTGVWCRAMLDLLPPVAGRRRTVIRDYKTAASVEPEALARAAHTFGYHQQDDHYIDGLRVLGYPDPGMLFICQERDPPYLVTIFELDPVARRIGAARNRWARQVYARCTADNHWPPYVEGIHMLSLPRWAELQEGALDL